MIELNYIDETIEKDENPALRIDSVGRSALSTVYLMDCIEGMKQFPDKIFDLAVVDPPYGINVLKTQFNNQRGKTKMEYNISKKWDANSPDLEYFVELFRVSKNQILWGANHYIEKIPYNSSCWIIWDKAVRGNRTSDVELAWTSFKSRARKFTFKWEGYWQGDMKNKEKRIHPTQKPIKLYEWIFANYAEDGNLILDTHLGSQSSRIAANKAGLDFVGFEIDQEYFDNGNKRFKNFVSQGVLF